MVVIYKILTTILNINIFSHYLLRVDLTGNLYHTVKYELKLNMFLDMS